MQNISIWRRILNAFGYIRRGDFVGLAKRILFIRRDAYQLQVRQKLHGSANVWGIISTPHTLFIAQIMADRLDELGISHEIMTAPPKRFDHDFYFVLCAQIFDRLPPPDRRIIFQLEQSVSSRWFTEAYFDILKNSIAVLDYSLDNIRFLAGNEIAYPHVHYLPIGADPSLTAKAPVAEKKFDFLFYGDSYSSPRRQQMLEALQARFNVNVCNEVFGAEMHDLIRQTRAVVNLHYYENALLETPRIQECLSLGVPVLSERSQNQAEYPLITDAVRFFEEGSIDAMLAAAGDMLQDLETANDQVVKSAQESARQFRFMFDRCLVAVGVLSPSHWESNPVYLPADDRAIVLSLPETIERRAVFVASDHEECTIFDGIRYQPGWIGCGLSYKTLARAAAARGIEKLTVFEDDAVFPTAHAKHMAIVDRYLSIRDEPWDIFAGVIAIVHPQTKVHNVERLDGMVFVTIDHMTSMVYNIYNRPALDLLAEWDPTNTDAETNTIDKYIEGQKTLRVVVALPFLVGHREEVHSTLWGVQNTTYAKLIAESEETISALAHDWENSIAEPV